MKKIINQIRKLGLSVKREFIIFGLANAVIIIATVLLGIFQEKMEIFIFGGGFAVVFSIFYLNRYESMIKNINTENMLDFAEVFGFFRIYIKNGYNVYSALKEISFFANENLKRMFNKLLEEIDNDKSVQPFVNFARNFDDIIIEELMVSIYQMIDDGEQSNYLVQFEFLFDKFSEVLIQKQLKKKDSLLGTLSSAPLVGSCFLIIVITVGIVGMLGEITNGI